MVERVIKLLVILLVAILNMRVETKKMPTSQVEGYKKLWEPKKTGCLCPADVEIGYIYQYCGRELKPTSTGNCYPEQIYNCLEPNTEAFKLVFCGNPGGRHQCISQTCTENNEGCKMPHSKWCS